MRARSTMGAFMLAAVGAVALADAQAADIAVIPTKLIVVDKLVKVGKAKAVYVAKDPAATKGAGLDVEQISVQLDVAYGNGSAVGAFVVPSGTASGWLVNKESVAKYVNKNAPAGPTETKVAVIKPGKLLKLVGKGLGDTDIDILGAGDPGGPVHTAYCVTNGLEENCHCSEFTGCAWKPIAGGTGAKLVCKTGSGNASCGAPTTTSTSTSTSTTTSTSPACVDHLLGGGFETGPGGGSWTEFSTNFGSPICDLVSCGNGGGTGPRSGVYWVFLGGTTLDETAYVSQSVVIDVGTTTLTFWLEIPACEAFAVATFSVSLDGNVIYSATGSDAACGQLGYAMKAVDVSDYADGNSHMLEFRGDFQPFIGITNFFVDDVGFAPCL